VLGHLGLKVNRLIRVSFGPFQLGELAPGEVVEVKTRTLRDQLGERLAAAAGADFAAPIAAREPPAAPRPAATNRSRQAPPQQIDAKRKRRRIDSERIGQPELARRKKRRGRRRRAPGEAR
jgi:23S rRNA pseudouridine2605 synthase